MPKNKPARTEHLNNLKRDDLLSQAKKLDKKSRQGWRQYFLIEKEMEDMIREKATEIKKLKELHKTQTESIFETMKQFNQYLDTQEQGNLSLKESNERKDKEIATLKELVTNLTGVIVLPEFLVKKINDGNNMFECPVCKDDCELKKDSQYKMTVCGHFFCTVCYNNWIKNNDTCPTCRKNLGIIRF